MRVVIRIPTENVAEYDLPKLDNRATDADILAAAAKAKPIRDETIEVVGQPYVFSRGPDDLAEQGRRMQQAEERLGQERAEARRLALRFLDDGMRKSSIAAQLGITRATLDAWEQGRPSVGRKRRT